MNLLYQLLRSHTWTILTNIATVSALSLLPKLLVVVKDAIVAFYFGTGQALDIYLIAFVMIGIPVSTIVVALQTVLISALVGKDAETAARLLGGALKFIMAALLFALPIWLLLLPYMLDVLYSGAAETMLSDLQEACYWLIPYYFLNGISLLLYGALQARKIFWPNALIPGFFPLSIIIAVGLMQEANILALLMGTIMGSVLECMALYGLLLRGKAIRWWQTSGSGLRSLLCMSLPLMVGAIVSSMAPLIEQMIAFRLGSGAVSLLSYGNKVPMAVNSLLVTAVGIVILPHFADLIAARRWRESKALHLRLSLISLAIGGAVTVVGFVFAEEIIRLFFERGAFTAADSQEAANVMRAYLLQLPFLLAAMMSLRTLAAMGKTWSMTSISAIQLALGSSLAYLFSARFGVSGVAMGTTVSVLIGTGLLAWTTRLELKNQLMRSPT